MNDLVYIFLKNSVRSVKKSFIDRIHFDERLALPTSPRNDDVYLVSYPKSGNTWLEFLIANVNVLMSNKRININFFNIHQYIADIHTCRNISDPILEFPGYRFIKSHSEFNPYYGNVIYISRDPRDVMLSYYHYLTRLGFFQGSITDLIASNQYGIVRWVMHVDKWFNKSSASTGFIHIRYEDLKFKTEATLSRTYYQLGYDIPPQIISKAVLNSSFENMRELEDSNGYGGRSLAKKFNFMRQGSSGQGRVEISADDLSYIANRASVQMDMLGYS